MSEIENRETPHLGILTLQGMYMVTDQIVTLKRTPSEEVKSTFGKNTRTNPKIEISFLDGITRTFTFEGEDADANAEKAASFLVQAMVQWQIHGPAKPEIVLPAPTPITKGKRR